MKISAQNRRDIFHLDVAAAQFMYDLQHRVAAVVDESVPIPSPMLLALEIYALLKAWRKPGADGLRRVVVTIHDDH